MRLGGQAVFVSQPHTQTLGFPNHRPFAAVLDVVGLPIIAPEQGRISGDVPHLHRGIILDLQTRELPRVPRAAGVFAIKQLRAARPEAEVRRHFADIFLPHGVQGPQERRLAAITFIKGHPFQKQAVASCPFDLFQADQPLGAVYQIIGNPRSATTLPIFMPSLLGQIQFAIEQRMEVRRGIAQMDADHAVLGFARRPAVLPLHAGGLVPLLDETGLVENADALLVRVPRRHQLLTTVPHRRLVPAIQTQKLLQIPRWNPGGVRYGLKALTRQGPQLTLHVGVDMPPRRAATETIVVLVQIVRQRRSNSQNRFSFHARTPFRNTDPERLHRPANYIFLSFCGVVVLTGVVQVGIDDVAVGDMAAKYLLSLGLKNLALVGDYSTRYALERRDAFLRILHAEDLKCYQWDPTEKHRPPVEHLRRGGTSASSPGSHTFSATAWSSSFRRQWGDAVSQWITDLPKPVGIFALNDDWATMIVDQCNHQSIAVPEQVAILGVDNAELLCQMGRPPLSSIETPAEKVGWEAGVALEKLMEGKPVSSRQLLQPVRVVERQSTNILAIDDPDVTAAIRFIQANVHRGIGVREVLMTVPSRRRTLEMSFRKSVGRSILDEIQRLRVERAKMLLSSTDLKLSVVAQRSGFRCASRLCRMFRQVSGETPAHFRRRRELA